MGIGRGLAIFGLTAGLGLVGAACGTDSSSLRGGFESINSIVHDPQGFKDEVTGIKDAAAEQLGTLKQGVTCASQLGECLDAAKKLALQKAVEVVCVDKSDVDCAKAVAVATFHIGQQSITDQDMTLHYTLSGVEKCVDVNYRWIDVLNLSNVHVNPVECPAATESSAAILNPFTKQDFALAA